MGSLFHYHFTQSRLRTTTATTATTSFKNIGLRKYTIYSIKKE